MKVTNNSQALQGVRFGGEVRWIKPGEFFDGEMSDDEAKLIDGNDLLHSAGVAPAANDKPDYERDSLKDVDLHKPATSKDVLLVIAAYEKVQMPQGDDATKAEIIKAIEAKRKGAAK